MTVAFAVIRGSRVPVVDRPAPLLARLMGATNYKAYYHGAWRRVFLANGRFYCKGV